MRNILSHRQKGSKEHACYGLIDIYNTFIQLQHIVHIRSLIRVAPFFWGGGGILFDIHFWKMLKLTEILRNETSSPSNKNILTNSQKLYTYCNGKLWVWWSKLDEI